MEQFLKQYQNIEPFLKRPGEENFLGLRQLLQSPKDRDKLNGLYECILCGCCTYACPPYWWLGDKFLGPATLLQVFHEKDESILSIIMNQNSDYISYLTSIVFDISNTILLGLITIHYVGLQMDNRFPRHAAQRKTQQVTRLLFGIPVPHYFQLYKNVSKGTKRY